jgi:hypothetical protein
MAPIDHGDGVAQSGEVDGERLLTDRGNLHTGMPNTFISSLLAIFATFGLTERSEWRGEDQALLMRGWEMEGMRESRNKSADCGFEGGKKIRKSNGTGWLLSANLSGPLVALAHGPVWAPSTATGGSLPVGSRDGAPGLASVPARPEAPVHLH